MFINRDRFLGKIRKQGVSGIVATFLIIMLSVLIVSAVPGLVVVFREELLTEPRWVIDSAKIPIVLDLVLWTMISIELMDSIRIYIAKHILHLETIISLAMIAMARKIITLQLEQSEPVTILGVAVLVVGVAIAYYFIRKSHKEHGIKGIHESKEDEE